MKGFATKVWFEAHDGGDFYCKFANLEAFITGYWKFIGRSPYKGWEAHSDTPENYIRFIGPSYCPRPGYAEDVLTLLPEAEELLAHSEGVHEEVSFPAQPEVNAAGLSFYVGAGHSNVDPGAVAGALKEAELVMELRNLVAAGLREKGATVVTDGEDKTNLPLPDSITLAKTCHSGRIELHLNSATPAANGVECLSLVEQCPQSRIIAKAIADTLSLSLRGDKGWKPDTSGQHSRLAFCRKAHGIVVECFFLSNPEELQKYAAGKQGAAKAIAAALIESANNAPGI